MADQRDLWVHDNEHGYLIPHGAVLPPGDTEIVRIDGHRARVDLAQLDAWKADDDAIGEHMQAAMRDAIERLGAAAGAVAHLFDSVQAGQATPRPGSLDQALGLDEGLEGRMGKVLLGAQKARQLAERDPEVLRNLANAVADQWAQAGAPELATGLRAAPDALGAQTDDSDVH